MTEAQLKSSTFKSMVKINWLLRMTRWYNGI